MSWLILKINLWHSRHIIIIIITTLNFIWWCTIGKELWWEQNWTYEDGTDKQYAGWQMESSSFSLYRRLPQIEREREGRRWQTGNREVKQRGNFLFLFVYLYVNTQLGAYFNFWLFVPCLWIFQKERDLEFRHHESLRPWKQVFIKIHSFFV